MGAGKVTTPDEHKHDGIGWALIIGIVLGVLYYKIYSHQIDGVWRWLLRERHCVEELVIIPIRPKPAPEEN
jgi:hypothetical protein